jgi:hypothetical protein
MTNRAIEQRLRRLEAAGNRDQIAVWCEDEADVAATIEAMIAEGEIREADRHRCVHWEKVTTCAPGTHDAALLELD